ncbi:hypothetical protein AB1Y20_009461 [Prymnesium parvum]|uniref:Uncharacterized protein n=1 Tax=Prymnesium parvum TaxID=97485 RepID=A0AB34K1I2_PRYPA
MLGPYGNLKAQALQPGPGAYNIVIPESNIGGGKFGRAPRTMMKDYKENLNFVAAMKKERAYMHANMVKQNEGDALDQLIAETAKAPVIARRPPPMKHEEYLKQIDTMPRLLTGNVFPGAAHHSPKMSVQAGFHARPWLLSRENQNKMHYHRPNEFSEMIKASARMGVNLYQNPQHKH